MFAHQVIEDLKGNIVAYNGDDSYIAQLRVHKHILSNIESCQKFHIGDVSDILHATKNIENVDLKILRLPYKKIYMDFICPTHIQLAKTAAIVIESEEGHQVFFMQNGKQLKRWYPASSFLDYNQETKELNTHIRKGLGEEDKKIETQWVSIFGKLVYKTLVLLTCKNIVTEKIIAPIKLNKKRRLSGKQELFDYHVLNVVIPSKRKGYQEKGVPLSHNRVHLCRGHFKEYTTEHPLFGRLTGLYWWQPHVRGQNKDGIVMKDYKISTVAGGD